MSNWSQTTNSLITLGLNLSQANPEKARIVYVSQNHGKVDKYP